MDSLRRRALQDMIYTNAGDVLISVNPYKNISGLYDSPLHYLDLPDDEDIEKTSAKPHVFAIANYALLQLLQASADTGSEMPINQSIIVSGESGAGKVDPYHHPLPYYVCLKHPVS